jgi:hypothetical protein
MLVDPLAGTSLAIARMYCIQYYIVATGMLGYLTHLSGQQPQQSMLIDIISAIWSISIVYIISTNHFPLSVVHY